MIIIIITIRKGVKCPRCGSKQEGRNLILQCCKAEPPTVEKAQCQPLIKCVTLNRWLFLCVWSMRSSVSSLVKQSPWVFPALTFWLQDHVCPGPDCEGHGCLCSGSRRELSMTERKEKRAWPAVGCASARELWVGRKEEREREKEREEHLYLPTHSLFFLKIGDTFSYMIWH